MSNQYVYFAFQGDVFDPSLITTELGIDPSDSWKKGESGKYVQQQKFSCWKLSSTIEELLDMDKLIHEVVPQLSEKIDQINNLKNTLTLKTVLEIVIYVDIDEEKSTPFLGHNLEIIEFFNGTRTYTDVDIYRCDTENK